MEGPGEPKQPPILLPYDNEVTLLYKWSHYYQLPARLILIRSQQGLSAIAPGAAELTFQPLTEAVSQLVSQGRELFDINYDIAPYLHDASAEDVAMVYMDTRQGQGATEAEVLAEVNNFYHEFEPDIGGDKYETTIELQEKYSSWYTHLILQLQRDETRLQTINDVHEQLQEISRQEQIEISPLMVKGVLLAFRPTISGRATRVDDGFETFNQLRLSSYVPFAQYNSSDSSYYKVYRGSQSDDEPNYQHTILDQSKERLPDTIYLTLWIGREGSVLSRAPRESLVMVEYHLHTNYLTVDIPLGMGDRSVSMALATERIQRTLSMLTLGKGEEVKVRGRFNMYGVTVEEISLLHLILNEPVFQLYLYVEESIDPHALKKRLDVHYRSLFKDEDEADTPTTEAYISNSAAVSVTIVQKRAGDGELVEVVGSDGIAKKVHLEKDAPYLRINIGRADSRQAINEFILIFRLLMRAYIEWGPEAYQEYLAIIPSIAQLQTLAVSASATKERKGKGARKKEGRAAVLREMKPDLFVDNYARSCQSERQPTIISAEQAEQWRQSFFNNRSNRGASTQRQVMPFPKDVPPEQQLMIVCPDDEYPFPGVRLNRKLENKERYPYVPCCFKYDQMSDPSSRYSEYYKNIPMLASEGAKADTPIRTNKILSAAKTALLPTAVRELLSNYNDVVMDMRRCGVTRSVNSLLHCVLVAVDDPQYYNQPNEEAQERYVQQLRAYIARTVSIEVLRQELYDKSDQEIRALLADNQQFFDPYLLYRAVEEAFRVNLYVFNLAKSGEGGGSGSLELPRFHLFHSRALRLDRPTVVVLKHLGSESNALTYPQCELIIDYHDQTNEGVKLFGESMTQLCQAALLETLSTITWKYNGAGMVGRINIYSNIDYLELLRHSATHQYIDPYGKMRALSFTARVNHTAERMTLVVPPSQPVSLPASSEVYRGRAESAASIFGEPSGITMKSGQVSGLWFPVLDIEYGVYVPVQPTVTFRDKPIGPDDPMEREQVSIAARIRRIKRTLDMILQLLHWLFELYKLTKDADPDSFAAAFFGVEEGPVPDSSLYYDLSRLPRHLPSAKDPAEGIARLSQLTPTLFREGRIVFYNGAFAEKALNELHKYARETAGLPASPAPLLLRYYSDETIFQPQPHVVVFIGGKDLSSWLGSVSKLYHRFYGIRTRLTSDLMSQTEPYLYRDANSKVFLIQNVAAGDRARAYTVCIEWYDHSINLGFSAEPTKSIPAHIVYSIGNTGDFALLEDNRGATGASSYVSLLTYELPDQRMTRYAAVLELN